MESRMHLLNAYYVIMQFINLSERNNWIWISHGDYEPELVFIN